MKKAKKLIMPRRGDYLAVYGIAFATLMYELLLTRLFSVVMWYHFAFVAISAALFGMTLGAIGVYVLRDKIRQRGERRVMAEWSLIFGLLILPALAIFIFKPSLALLIPAITLPFIASGVVLALALTYFSGATGKVYSADLAGAATGCFGVIAALELTDGPTALLLAASIALVSGIGFAGNLPKLKRTLAAAAVFTAALVGLSFAHIVINDSHLFRVLYGKHGREDISLYEEWNSFSRVNVIEGGYNQIPFGWALSNRCDQLRPVDQLALRIDGDAETPLTKFDGNPANYRYLECDVTNLAHHIVPEANIGVVGAGGGRDVLSGLVFGAKSIKAIEINDEIVNAVTKRYADYVGNLAERPGVQFINDEARSYLTRHADRYDILQISLIDTWAATAAGGYTMSENSLYTAEAWDLFINRLSDRGVLSVSRWYNEQFPYETYRTVSLAQNALKQNGITDTNRHIAVILAPPNQATAFAAVANVMVARNPYTAEQIAELYQLAAKYDFSVLAAPGQRSDDPVLTALVNSDYDQAAKLVQANIAPPTDTQPFFFNFIRPQDLAEPNRWGDFGVSSVALLVVMLITVLILVVLVLLVPLAFARQHINRDNVAMAAYFLGIGFGFMGVEMGMLQRLAIFFGHPAFSLVVVLPTILAASGLGSLFTELKNWQKLKIWQRLVVLLAVLALTIVAMNWFIGWAVTAALPVRIGGAMLLLVPVSFMMGMPFALGMRWASQGAEDLKPWLWGINGVASVAASVLAVLASVMFGVTAAFITGAAGYLLTTLAALRANRVK